MAACPRPVLQAIEISNVYFQALNKDKGITGLKGVPKSVKVFILNLQRLPSGPTPIGYTLLDANTKAAVESLIHLLRIAFDYTMNIEALLGMDNIYIEYNDIPVALCSVMIKDHVATLYNVCTHPIFQNRGLATNLLKEIIGTIRTNTTVHVIGLTAAGYKDVWGSNLSSRMTLYASLGFLPTKGQRIRFHDVNIIDSANMVFQKNIYVGIIVDIITPTRLLVRIKAFGEIKDVVVDYDSIVDSAMFTGVEMIWSAEIFASVLAEPALISKISPVKDSELLNKNRVDLTTRTEPPELNSQYSLTCHGQMIFSDTLIEIPENIELITFGGLGTFMPVGLLKTAETFINLFSNRSIQSIQALFPPFFYSLGSHPSKLASWIYPPYYNIPKDGSEIAHFYFSKLLHSDFSRKNIVETYNGAVGKAVSSLFYVNSFKSGDKFFDMTLAGLDPKSDSHSLQYLLSIGSLSYNMIVTKDAASNFETVENLLPLQSWISAGMELETTMKAPNMLNSKPLLLSSILGNFGAKFPGRKIRIYLYCCHTIGVGSPFLNYFAIKEVSMAPQVDSGALLSHYKGALERIVCVDEELQSAYFSADIVKNGGGISRRNRKRLRCTRKRQLKKQISSLRPVLNVYR